jgi:hypothetical protein
MDRKRLVYVIGAGRSGTTILDIILGNIDGGLSLGEVNRYYKRNGIPPLREPNDAAAIFWSEFRARLEATHPIFSDFKNLKKEQEKNEYHTAAFRVLFGRTAKRYKKHLKAFYEVLLDYAPGQIIIESSKYPLRAINLFKALKSLPLEVEFVYLKKDPIQVVESFNRKGIEQPSKGFWAANLYYLLTNGLCILVVKSLSKQGARVCTITYKQLSLNPIETLEQIERELEISTKQVQKLIQKAQPLNTGVMFDGNRIRLQSEIKHKPNGQDRKPSNLREYTIRGFNYLVYRK